jgi:hypothetical protein
MLVLIPRPIPVVDFEKLFDTDSEQRNRITLQSL